MEVKIINKSGLPDPCYATEFSSGMDLCSCSSDDVIIEPMQRLVVKTGIYLEIPDGYEAQIRPRSGMSLKYGITCVNSPGTIDADYRGEIGVILINLSKESYTIKLGDRIAQMVFAPFTKVKFTHTDTLSETARGEGGYGHTGKNERNREINDYFIPVSETVTTTNFNETINYSTTSQGTTTRKFIIPVGGMDKDGAKEILREYIDINNNRFVFNEETGTVVINNSVDLLPLSEDFWFGCSGMYCDTDMEGLPPFTSDLWILCHENDTIIYKYYHKSNETDFSIGNFKFDAKLLNPNKIKYFIKTTGEKAWLYDHEKAGIEIIHESCIFYNPPKLVK